MKKYYHLIILIFSGLILNACSSKNDAKPDESGLFMKLLGGNQNDYVTDFFVNDNGEVIGTGKTQSFKINSNNTNIFLFRTDNLGNKIWQKGLGGHEGNAIIPTNDGGYAILGTFSEPPSDSLHLLKINPQGNIDWQKKYNPNIAGSSIKGFSLGIGKDNNYLLMGTYINILAPTITTNMYFVKVKPNGDTISQKMYGYIGQNNELKSAKILANGDAVVVGTFTNNTDSKIRMTLIDPDLGIKWDFNYESDILSSSTKATDIQIANSGFIVVGVTTTNNKKTGFLLKTNSNGLVSWKKNIDIGNSLDINSVYPTEDGGYILTGSILMTDKEIPHTNIWVGKVNAVGTLEWDKHFGNRRDDTGNCVRVTKQGNYVVMGNLDFGTNAMLVLINLDKNGDIIR